MSLLYEDREPLEIKGDLEQFIVQVPTIAASMDGESAKEIFDRQPDAEGIVVLENNGAVGIIMRTAFFQRMGTLYGHSLYMKRSVSILMNTNFMKVNVTDNISRISIDAMKREQAQLYDFIVVNKNMSYIGVISIRQFLVELSKQNQAQISVLQNQQQLLLSANEQEVQLRKLMEYQSASVSNLLNHADQGFLWFGKDLVIQNEYSFKCRKIFHANIGGLSFTKLVSPYFATEKGDVFQMAFDSYFKNNSAVTDHVYLMLLPSECQIHERNIHLEYRRIESNGSKAVMVILSDVTEKVNLEKAMEEDRNKQRLLMKAFSCQAQIKQILDEFRELFSGGYRSYFQNGCDFNDNLNELFRAVHTFKGDFAQYGFISASDYLHEFEDGLLSVINQGERAALSNVDQVMEHADPDKMLEKDLNIIYEILGNSYFDQSELISIPKEKLLMIEDEIQNEHVPLDKAILIVFYQFKRKLYKVVPGNRQRHRISTPIDKSRTQFSLQRFDLFRK